MGAGAGPGGFGGFDFGGFDDIFDVFFGGAGSPFGRRRGGPQRGADLQMNIEVSFEEAAFGIEREVSIHRWEDCKECGGSGAAPGTGRSPVISVVVAVRCGDPKDCLRPVLNSDHL